MMVQRRTVTGITIPVTFIGMMVLLLSLTTSRPCCCCCCSSSPTTMARVMMIAFARHERLALDGQMLQQRSLDLLLHRRLELRPGAAAAA